MVLSGQTIDNISRALKRQPSAIRARIRKLNILTDLAGHDSKDHLSMLNTKGYHNSYTTIGSPSGPLTLTFSFEWRPVLRDVKEFHSLLKPATPFMENHDRWPAVYRWVISKNTPEKLELLLIGSTKILCSDRLQGYLQSGNPVTNNGRYGIFRSYEEKGYAINTGILINLNTGGDNYQMKLFHLGTHSHREVMEELIIEHYKNLGFDLLNQ